MSDPVGRRDPDPRKIGTPKNQDAQANLRDLTAARVALKRAGKSLATTELLELTLSLAEARDAVHAELSMASLLPQLSSRELDVLVLHSAAHNRTEYLRRPDLGRQIDQASRVLLDERPMPAAPSNLVIAIADGLSAIAVERHVPPLLDALLPLLITEEPWQLGPVVVVEQARVAIGDEIGERLGTSLLLLLIGERPGLSSHDSLGAYLTWAPRSGRTDAERNCVSNIHAEGLSYSQAARKIVNYLTEARRLQLTGVALKEVTPLLEG